MSSTRLSIYLYGTPELTQDYNERTSLTSFRFAFSISGSILL